MKFNYATRIIAPFVAIIYGFVVGGIVGTFFVEGDLDLYPSSIFLKSELNDYSLNLVDTAPILAAIAQKQAEEQALVLGASIEEKDMTVLKKQIEEIIEVAKGEYGVYVTDLQTGNYLEINGYEIFSPESIYKVPFAMIILKDVENEELEFDDEFEMKERYKFAYSDLFYHKENGSLVTLDETLDSMLRNSDNTAQNVLYLNLDTTEEYNRRFQEELGLLSTAHAPFQTTPYDINKVFQIIYEESYLDEEYNNWILDVLTNTNGIFDDRIVAGVPEDTKVAHKIGNLSDVWQDAGIVYGPERDYILVVLNKDVDYYNAKNTIRAISSVTWDFFEEE